MSTVLLSKDEFPESLGGGLESDLTLHREGLERRWSVAIANKARLTKAESEEFRLKLEELTGLRWKHDSVSRFVFHYVPDSKEKIMSKETFVKVAAKGKINSCNKKKGSVDLKFGGLNFTGGQFEQLSRWIDDGDELLFTIAQDQGKLMG